MTPTTTGPDAPAPAGTLREATGARPLLLEHGRIWFVRSGRIDVFATRVAEGEPAGGRTHLFRVEEGQPLVGVGETAGLALLGVGAPGTTVEEFALGDLRALEPYCSSREAMAELLDAWVGHLYQGLGLDGRIPRHKGLEPGAELEANPAVNVRPVAEVAWLEQVAGSACLLGRPTGAVAAGTLLPIAGQAWVRTAEFSTLRLHGTEALLEARGYGAAWRALEGVHALVLALVAERLEEREAAQRERTRRQRNATQSAMMTALSRLATTMDARRRVQAPLMRMRPREEGELDENTLFPAFRLVAGAMGIELPAARFAHEQVQPKDPINALARNCRVRSRRVALRDGWWKKDNGPLLGRLAERKRAVALLPLPGGGYELIDPAERTQVKVDETVAGTLGGFGYTFYRPFGPDALRALDLLRFGMSGCRRDLTTVGAVAGVMALLGMVTPLAIGQLYNSVIPSAERGQLLQLTLGLVITALAVAVFSVVRGYAMLRIESKVGPALQAAVWDRLLTLPLPFFRDYTAGDLAVRAMGVEEMRTILSGAAVSVLLNGLFSLTNFVLLFNYHPPLAWIAALLIVVAVVVSLAISYLQLKSQRAIMKLRGRTSGLVLQLLTGIPKLKIVGAEVQGFGLWARMFSEQRDQQFRARLLGNVLAVFTAVFPLVSTLVLFAKAMPGIASGEMPFTTGDFLGFIAAFNIALAATLGSTSALLGTLAVVPLYEQIKPILETPPEVHAGKHDPGELSGAIELHRVTFRYQADGPAVLRDLSIRVRPGEFVAFVGPSGSGKSTTLRLLLGFEVLESGSVSFDEQDLSGLDLESVRRQIGVVVQSGRLMSGDIFTNIVGSSSASMDEAWEAARMAGLDEDIREMPMGMHTVVSDGGGTLSGGQRQRLMIARALVHRPRILFFDEATSALDNRTQDIVTRSLDRLKATRIVVAHRLSTIRNADRIYVIQAGEVVEAGSYDELMEREGVFSELARRQLV
ncbi:MAG TPA: NHLP bacteriocin export ABC transporter permease/ATPase subunit [Longimicrobiaceae bacterium]|nr:NHLP bacteriocin export ABC transporter permease/ATPase subunit [Longimicrobiaceae bacterium]